MSKYGIISGPYFPVFGLNTEKIRENTGDMNTGKYGPEYRKSPNTWKYGPEITLYFDTFHF